MKTGSKKQSFIESDTRPIALYNTAKPELFAVMPSPDATQKYLFPFTPQRRSNITRALSTKCKLGNTVIDVRVTLRYATAEQAALINGKGYWVKDGYYAPGEGFLFKGYDDKK